MACKKVVRLNVHARTTLALHFETELLFGLTIRSRSYIELWMVVPRKMLGSMMPEACRARFDPFLERPIRSFNGRSNHLGSRLMRITTLLRREVRSGCVKLRNTFIEFRQDHLYRTSALLITDNLVLGALGGLFFLVATHLWTPQSIGIVAATSGAVGLVAVASNLGMPSTIVAHLAREPDQALLVRGALITTLPVGIFLLVLLWFVPSHFGVPLNKLGVNTPTAVALSFLLVTSKVVVAIVDPVFLARQEVSWSVGKDITSAALRFLFLLVISVHRTAEYFATVVFYPVVSASIDLFLLRLRLRPGRNRSLGVNLIRPHAKFAIGNQASVLVALLPTSLLPIIVLGHRGASLAAFVAIPLTILGVLAIVPSMTAQSLFAELSVRPEQLAKPVKRALRGTYLATLPLAAATIATAPFLLDLFGHGYSIHGLSFLRWGAASSVFYCLNYVSDIVLLARKKVAAYFVANIGGTALVLLSLWIAVNTSESALGIGWFVGQGCYCAVSCIVLTRYVGRGNLISTARYILR